MQLDSDCWSEKEEVLLGHVSVERKTKISCYYHMVDRKLSLYAALIVRMGLYRMSGIPLDRMAFHAKPNNKPYLQKAPGYDFSLSHTQNAILCAISETERVGADIEKLNTPPYDIMDKIYHLEEINYINKVEDSENRRRRFYEVWTRKEAYTKQMGVGLGADLLTLNTMRADIFSYYLYTWEQDHYICSVCGEKKQMNQVVENLNEEQIWKFFTVNII